jgi:uncharacterized repeat protein (TIGR01451 family)
VFQAGSLCAVLLLFSIRCPGSERQALGGHVPRAASTARPVGSLAPGQKLNLALGLPLRNRPLLDKFLEQLYDPASTNYHQYLTSEQFAQEYGPTEQDYQSAIEFARTNGLTITAVHPNRVVLDVCGSVVDIDKAFQVSLRLYQHPAEPRTFYAPDTDPSLPSSVSLLHISGLDNYLIAHPAGLGPMPSPQGPAPVPLAGSGPGGAYRGGDFRGAYARAVSLNGAGQMVGLLEFEGYYLADIIAYRSQASVANVPLINVTMDGFDGTPGGNNVEVALDIELVSSIAPGLSQIIVYEAGPAPNGLANDVLNRMATDNLAKQLSASWTFATDATTEQIFLQFAAQGQAYFNASGDNGAYVGAVSSPTDDPHITIVGGTSLTTTGPGGAWVSETVWNRGVPGQTGGATGGGISTTFPIPAWQKSVNMSLNQGSVTMRNLPDVAAVAENVWITYNNGSSETVGGTSCSAPLWAGFLALVNQQGASFGRPPVGFLNPAIYTVGLGAGYSTNFHDVVIGNNTNSSSPNAFFAAAGYDLCTGWGSPFGQNLINALAPRIPSVVLTNAGSAIVSEGCSPPNGAIDPGETVTVSFSLKNLGAIKTTNLLAVLRPDSNVLFPSRQQVYGALAGGGAAVSRSFSFTAAGNCGDTITPTLELRDGPSVVGVLPFTFQLGAPVTAFTETFDEAAPPALPAVWTTTTSTNGVAVWITSTNLHDSSPNAAFADEPPNAGIEELISPPIPITSSFAQLVFRNNYNTEAEPSSASTAFDGGVLEIQIGTNAFADILAAGGSFAAGGYVRSIVTGTNDDNPLAGRRAWGGNSGGFITSIVNLPPAAAGQSVVLKWRFALDSGNFYGGSGWYIDTISIKDGAACCSSSADLAVSQTTSPEPVAPGQSLTYSIAITNIGPSTAAAVMLTNVLPNNVILSSASPGCFYSPPGYVTCFAGVLPAGAATNWTITVVPPSADPLTNLVQISSITPDPDLSNNTSLIVSSIATNAPPILYSQPADAVALLGASATFQATAFGIAPLGYQWLFNGTPLPGQTTTALALTNVQSGQMGAYTLLVSNANGSVTSAPAQLTVLEPPAFQLAGISSGDGAITVSLKSTAGRAYTLEFKNSLTDTNWTSILPAVQGTGGIISLSDTNTLSAPARFYRVVAQ